MKFEIGAAVFFYTLIDRVPGVVESARQDKQGDWLYSIRIGSTMAANDVPEHMIAPRTILDPPKYQLGDRVRFSINDEILEGKIEIVDSYGTFEQDEEPSYDIGVTGEKEILYKHIRESQVLERISL